MNVRAMILIRIVASAIDVTVTGVTVSVLFNCLYDERILYSLSFLIRRLFVDRSFIFTGVWNVILCF